MPSTVPMHAAYMRAIERASPMPLAAGTSAACSARVFHTFGIRVGAAGSEQRA